MGLGPGSLGPSLSTALHWHYRHMYGRLVTNTSPDSKEPSESFLPPLCPLSQSHAQGGDWVSMKTGAPEWSCICSHSVCFNHLEEEVPAGKCPYRSPAGEAGNSSSKVQQASHCPGCFEISAVSQPRALQGAVAFPESRWPLCACGCLEILLAHPWADPDCQDYLELCPVGLGSWALAYLCACRSCLLTHPLYSLHSVLRWYPSPNLSSSIRHHPHPSEDAVPGPSFPLLAMLVMGPFFFFPNLSWPLICIAVD